jgi:hypothetical protein
MCIKNGLEGNGRWPGILQYTDYVHTTTTGAKSGKWIELGYSMEFN